MIVQENVTLDSHVIGCVTSPPSVPALYKGVKGGVGSPSTGAEGSSRPSSPASLSDNRVDAVVDHQATAVGMATGEEVSGAGTMSVPASVIGRRGRGVRAAASGSSRSGGSRVLQPCIRLQRLAGTRPSAASVEVAMTISDDDESDDSEASTSTVSAASVYSDAVGPGATTAATTGRKRGRPPTTGEYVGLTEAKKRLLELKRQELELYDEAAVLDPTVPPPRVSRSCKPLRDKAGVAAEMRHAPTPDLGAVIAEKVAVVEKVAGTSKHLKGTYVHSLREAALFIRHTAAEQAKRTVVSEKEVELERELRQLRARLEATEALSRAHDDGLAAGANGAPALDAVAMPPPSPPGSRRSRRASARAAAGVAQVEPAPPPAPLSPPRVEGEAFSRGHGFYRHVPVRAWPGFSRVILYVRYLILMDCLPKYDDYRACWVDIFQSDVLHPSETRLPVYALLFGDTSVSSAAANFGEVGGPGLVKSTHTTSTWCHLGPLVTSVAVGADGVCGALGTPGAGVGVVVERATPMSLSDAREDPAVDRQAAGVLNTTGEEKGDPPLGGAAGSLGTGRLQGGARYLGLALAMEISDGEESDTSRVSAVSVASSVRSSASGLARKRGRPPTTGEHVGLAEAKRKLLELGLQERRLREEDDLLDRSVPPRPVHKSCKKLPAEKEVAEEMRQAPTPDLGAVMIDSVQTIEKVARCSSNLKGTSVRALREAAQRIRHAAAEQARRTVLSERELELEIEVKHLRARLSSLEALSGPRLAAAAPTAAPTEEPSAAGVPDDRQMPPPAAPPPGPSEPEVGARPLRRRPVRSPPLPPLPPSPPSPRWAPPERERPVTMADVEGAVERHVARLVAVMEARILVRLDGLPDVPGHGVGWPPAGTRMTAARGSGPRATPASSRRGPPPPPPRPSLTGPSAAGTSGMADGTGGVGAVAGGEGGAGRGGRRPRGSRARGGTPRPLFGGPSLLIFLPPRDAAAVAAQGAHRRPPDDRHHDQVVGAVALTVTPGSAMTYAEVMRTAMSGVRLADVGVHDLRYRKGLTGSSILEIPGPDSAARADALAQRLGEVFRGTDVRVSRPMRTAEIRITGLDESVTAEDAVAAIAAAGGCTAAEVRAGAVRRNRSGLGGVWVKCPLAAAKRLATAGRVSVGWSSAGVELLAARPLRCFRCLEAGHVRPKCPCDTDRGGRCYVCGGAGHVARDCQESPRCPVCSDLGRPAGHRLGGRDCAPPPSRRRKRRGAVATPPGAAAATQPQESQPAPVAPAEGREGGSGPGEAMDTA
ncbi:Cellular nucleic acid-binding protein [Dufourea novaeangliae]|uniref:Cellular nucleic acid-binding protein n=1 Tax=Dufourea novaeangliae TaxID=178035 RepID=A0A154P4S4_DUFNO|nr:Cellular nucleic acid-binding protein [Dufourea novaeangliae]